MRYIYFLKTGLKMQDKQGNVFENALRKLWIMYEIAIFFKVTNAKCVLQFIYLQNLLVQ